jgi:tetratricopeptide (TPR) repeat protein
VEPRAHAPAHGRLGRIAGSFDADPAAAARHFEHALTLEPANTDIISNAAGLAASLGRLDTAIALYEYANARDPLTLSVMQTWPLPTSTLGAWTRPSPMAARRCAWLRSPEGGATLAEAEA